MQRIRNTVSGPTEPNDTHVFWVDTSDPENPVLKMFNGGWVAVSESNGGGGGGSSAVDIELDIEGWSNYYSAWGDVLKNGAGTRLHFQYTDPYFPDPTLNCSYLIDNIRPGGYGNQYSITMNGNSNLAYPTPDSYYNSQRVIDEMMENGLATDIGDDTRYFEYYSISAPDVNDAIGGNVARDGGSDHVYVLAYSISRTTESAIWAIPTVKIDGQDYVCALINPNTYYAKVETINYYLKSAFTPSNDYSGIEYYNVSKESIDAFVGCWVGVLGD